MKVVFDNVSKHYGSITALKNLNFKVNSGEFLFIEGVVVHSDAQVRSASLVVDTILAPGVGLSIAHFEGGEEAVFQIHIDGYFGTDVVSTQHFAADSP